MTYKTGPEKSKKANENSSPKQMTPANIGQAHQRAKTVRDDNTNDDQKTFILGYN